MHVQRRGGRTESWVKGFTLVELLVVMAVIGIVSAFAMPSFVNYLRAASLKAGAEEFASILNLARSVAIKENSQVCVVRDGTNRVRLLIATANPCAATTNFYGGGGRGVDARIDANGWMTLTNGVTVSASTASVVFNYLGAAVPAGTYTVDKSGNTLSVVVAASGRVTITP